MIGSKEFVPIEMIDETTVFYLNNCLIVLYIFKYDYDVMYRASELYCVIAQYMQKFSEGTRFILIHDVTNLMDEFTISNNGIFNSYTRDRLVSFCSIAKNTKIGDDRVIFYHQEHYGNVFDN